ncbi:MAG: SWFGD domain-containing protein [Alphaproteobacteria bacterium]|nr:MAG: SWFGD domain-containing protein [Alphaproteobacteria bacterium]
MGFGDNRYGDDRGQGREYYRGGYGREQGRGPGGHDHRGGPDDRGFIERAGDEVRSWFGDDDAQRRREMDERRWEREHRMTGNRDNDWGREPRGRSQQDDGPGSFGGGDFGGG